MHLRARGESIGLADLVVGRITVDPRAELARQDHVLLRTRHNRGIDAHGFAAVLSTGDDGAALGGPGIFAVPALAYLEAGDVVALHPSGLVEVLFRRASPHNTLLTTERCNSLCIMCSQPPREVDDSWRVPQILRAIDLIDPMCEELGFTGGEPTLLGDGFFEIIKRAKNRLPRTALHVLTNGRLFADPRLAIALGTLAHPDIMLGIPLYSDLDNIHDFVVQVQGAFEETIAGLYHLAEAGVPIELRLVVHGTTYRRLPQFAEFVVRYLPFVAQVALMGLEMFGYVHQNMSTVWVDPEEYQEQLEQATATLALHQLRPVIFNHQLCVLRRSLWPFTVKSISDWKNVYLPICDGCAVRSKCGGFFHSGTKRYSARIHPLAAGEC